MLFNEPKLLKFRAHSIVVFLSRCFSALQRAEIAEINDSVLYARASRNVSVLFNEPKLLKSSSAGKRLISVESFSALQRAEIAEINDMSAHVQNII